MARKPPARYVEDETPELDPNTPAPTLEDATTDNAPRLEDAVEGEATAETPKPETPSANKLTEKIKGLTDKKILELLGRGFTVGLPMTPDLRKAFVEAYAEDETVQFGWELVGAGGGIGSLVTGLIESNPLARLAIGSLLVVGGGIAQRMDYAAQLQQLQALAAASANSPVNYSPQPDSREPVQATEGADNLAA
jgi:hypothetical protein